jgi:hypothetical protein
VWFKTERDHRNAMKQGLIKQIGIKQGKTTGLGATPGLSEEFGKSAW